MSILSISISDCRHLKGYRTPANTNGYDIKDAISISIYNNYSISMSDILVGKKKLKVSSG